MRRTGFAVNTALALSILAAAPMAARGDDGSDKILEFETMAGVTRPFTGPANPVRGLGGGGLPWVIGRGKGEVRADGRLEVKVRGLVLADDPAVAPASRLTNPSPTFRVVVSCITVDAAGAPAEVNVATGPFPATPQGDAEIEAALELPSPCLAPVLFVTNAALRWFAVTGR